MNTILKRTEIAGFNGEYRFLSNFWYSPIVLEEIWFRTAEHAFQSAKGVNFNEVRQVISAATPGDAKRLGRKIQMKDNWMDIRNEVMELIVRAKFQQNTNLKDLLIETGDLPIIELNNWGDTYWGMTEYMGIRKGQNFLGKILMKIRSELSSQ